MDTNLNELEQKTNIYKCKKIIHNCYFKIFGCFVCVSLLSGLIYLNIQCDSFSYRVPLCEVPNYCPIKSECNDYSNNI